MKTIEEQRELIRLNLKKEERIVSLPKKTKNRFFWKNKPINQVKN